MKPRKPKIQWARKLGHLWQVCYGFPGRARLGYGLTRKLATAEAKKGDLPT